MLKFQTWKPDTSDSVVTYQYDDAQPGRPILGASREEQPSNVTIIVSKANHHQHLPKDQQYDAIREENQQKNKFEGMILEQMPELTETLTAPDGMEMKKLKPGLKYHWSFDKNRKLQAEIRGANTVQKARMKSLAEVHPDIDTKKVEIK